MLVKDFYTVKSLDTQENKVKAVIELNKSHKVYEGHFPEQPIVPGVIQLQITKEIFADSINKKLQLHSAANIKYMSLIVPNENSILTVSMEYTIKEDNLFYLKASITDGEKVFFKFKGKFSEKER